MDLVGVHQVQNHIARHLRRNNQRVERHDLLHRAAEFKPTQQAAPDITVGDTPLQATLRTNDERDLQPGSIQVADRLLNTRALGKQHFAPELLI